MTKMRRSIIFPKFAILAILTTLVAAALIVSTAVVANPVDSPWTGSGSGTTTVVSDGSSAAAEFTYDNSGVSASLVSRK